MNLSESKKEEVVTEPKGLLVLGGYNMDYVTEVPQLLISVNCELEGWLVSFSPTCVFRLSSSVLHCVSIKSDGSGGAGGKVQRFANDGKDGGGEDASCERFIITLL